MQVILGILAFSLPLLAGGLFRFRSAGLTYLSGQLLLWCAFQMVAVPAINLRLSFTVLFWIYFGVALVLCAAGAVHGIRQGRPWFDRPEISIFLILAALVILFQACVYIFGMHLDEDDARWIAEANDALVKDRMLLHNPATGEYIGRFVGEMQKDVFSPWAFYIAFLSRLTGIRAVVIAHTVYPPILLVMSYLAYWEMGRQLFKGKSERGIFLLMVSVINLFMAGNVYTQSVFTLTRIWQGKAVVAAIIIPAILMIALRIQNENRVRDWGLLSVTACAACLFSGMGIAIGLLMVAVYGLYAVVCRRWKRLPLWLLSLLPSLAYGFGYLQLRG